MDDNRAAKDKQIYCVNSAEYCVKNADLKCAADQVRMAEDGDKLMGKTSKVAYEFLKNENATLRAKLEDAEMLAERRKWGAQEMDRLRGENAAAEKLFLEFDKECGENIESWEPNWKAVALDHRAKIHAAIDGKDGV